VRRANTINLCQQTGGQKTENSQTNEAKNKVENRQGKMGRNVKVKKENNYLLLVINVNVCRNNFATVF